MRSTHFFEHFCFFGTNPALFRGGASSTVKSQEERKKHMGIFGAAVALFGKGGSQPVKDRPRASHSDDTTQSKGTILIIDDDPSFLDSMRTVLSSEGYNVLASSTGPKGLDMVRYARGDVGVI